MYDLRDCKERCSQSGIKFTPFRNTDEIVKKVSESIESSDRPTNTDGEKKKNSSARSRHHIASNCHSGRTNPLKITSLDFEQCEKDLSQETIVEIFLTRCDSKVQKTMTVITGLVVTKLHLNEILKHCKRELHCNGHLKHNTSDYGSGLIFLQGDHREKVAKYMTRMECVDHVQVHGVI
jgi:translation initiation factor 1 (eIF-1/SUI1)